MRAFEVAPGITITPVLKLEWVYVLNNRQGLVRTMQTEVRLWALWPNKTAPVCVGHGVTWLSPSDKPNELVGIAKAVDRAIEDAEVCLSDEYNDVVVISRDERKAIASAVRQGYMKMSRRLMREITELEARRREFFSHVQDIAKKERQQQAAAAPVKKKVVVVGQPSYEDRPLQQPVVSDDRLAEFDPGPEHQNG
jgi:hypothetical protein